MPASPPGDLEVTPALLASMPLPHASPDAAKDDRGHVLVVGGSAETAGGVLLAGLAALRVGAGRVRLVTVASAAGSLMAAIPEGRVVGVDETPSGAIDPSCAGRVAELATYADVVLVGTGALDPDATEPLLDAVTAAAEGVVVVDVAALPAAGRHPGWLARLDGRALAIPNEAELSQLGGGDVRSVADRLGAVVSCRGPATLVCAPGGPVHVDRSGGVGLATSGSGDVAAGVVAGLVARGASPLAAAVWGAHLHGRAGERLAERVGRVGFLARELLDELPGLLQELSSA